MNPEQIKAYQKDFAKQFLLQGADATPEEIRVCEKMRESVHHSMKNLMAWTESPKYMVDLYNNFGYKTVEEFEIKMILLNSAVALAKNMLNEEHPMVVFHYYDDLVNDIFEIFEVEYV